MSSLPIWYWVLTAVATIVIWMPIYKAMRFENPDALDIMCFGFLTTWAAVCIGFLWWLALPMAIIYKVIDLVLKARRGTA